MAKRMMASSACAACRMQRKKCSEKCLFAPHFPADDPEKFTLVQRVFGTNHIVKMLQGLEDCQRADAVTSMVYEATARVKDPIHGSSSAIQQMTKKIAELETQLTATQTELTNMRSQYDNLVFLFGCGYLDSQHVLYSADATSQPIEDIMYDEVDPLPLWEI